jgi:rhamnopyranosyl-N-acetylglucosaminyl-diphospho-decaprenol beta-1,3/1,4-galactofuranosyltransferase
VGQGGIGTDAGDHLNASVCAVVPTFNRRDLLLETLRGIEQQTVAVATLVVDNGSTDDTMRAVASAHPAADILTLPSNSGSAGGFGAGAAWAVDHDYEWVWLLDNDSVPAPDAVEELLACYERFERPPRPVLLASKVTWTDGSILPLNVPILKRKNVDLLYWAAEHGALSLRAAPYAGLLVQGSAVVRHGLPIAEYFLWNDDIEWTGRVLKDELGVLVPRSVVCHKTPGNPSTTAHAGPRFYYEVRNKLWMLRFSDAYRPMEKARFAVTLAVDTGRFLRLHRPIVDAARIVLSGALAARRRPDDERRLPPVAER